MLFKNGEWVSPSQLSLRRVSSSVSFSLFVPHHTTVKAPAEAILDSKILVAASGAGALKARQLKLDANAFDTVEFLNKLILFMGGRLGAQGQKKGKGKRRAEEDDEDEDDEGYANGLKWGRVGRILAGESRRPATMDFM